MNEIKWKYGEIQIDIPATYYMSNTSNKNEDLIFAIKTFFNFATELFGFFHMFPSSVMSTHSHHFA